VLEGNSDYQKWVNEMERNIIVYDEEWGDGRDNWGERFKRLVDYEVEWEDSVRDIEYGKDIREKIEFDIDEVESGMVIISEEIEKEKGSEANSSLD